MKTNVIMESLDRRLGEYIIRQRTKDGYFALGDIMKVINMKRLSEDKEAIISAKFFQNENFKEFIAELEADIGSKSYIKATKSSTGWVHPYLAIKILTHYNPRLEIQVYKWLFDYLIENRITSSDSYTRMCGILFKYTTRQVEFRNDVKKLAGIIKNKIGVDDWNKASKEELEKRDYIQNMIGDLTQTLADCKLGVRLAFNAYDRKFNMPSEQD